MKRIVLYTLLCLAVLSIFAGCGATRYEYGDVTGYEYGFYDVTDYEYGFYGVTDYEYEYYSVNDSDYDLRGTAFGFEAAPDAAVITF